MSLIAAEIAPEYIIFTGDSKLTNRATGYASNLFTGSLKIVIISKSLCVAYADTQAYGESAIREISSDTPLDTVVSIFRQASASGEVEFLIGSASSNQRLLIKIQSGQVVFSAPFGRIYIGDVIAYGVFQNEYATALKSEIGSGIPEYVHKMGALQTAMKAVIENSSIPNVGDLQFTASNNGGGYMYHLSFQSEVVGSHMQPGMNRMPFSTGPGINSTLIEILTPEDRGVGIVCCFVHEIRQGAIYAPAFFPRPKVLTASSVHDFINRVKRETGVVLTPSGFN